MLVAFRFFHSSVFLRAITIACVIVTFSYIFFEVLDLELRASIAAISGREYCYCPRVRDQSSSPVRYSVGATLERHLIFFTARTSRLCSSVPDRKF